MPSGSIHSQDTSSTAELHYFTQNSCRPCVPVTKIVRALNANDRDIKIHIFEENEGPFRQWKIDWLPMFIVIEDGKETARYMQEGSFRFTGSFISGIAPMKATAGDRDCANPIAKVFKNIIPPPPAPGVRDIPDVEKVARIETLERMVRDMQLTINVLRKELADIESAAKGETGPAGRDGDSGPAGRDGKDGKPGERGPAGRDGVDGERGADGRDGIDGRDGSALSADSLRELKQLRADVLALKTLPRRFVIADGKEILGDLTYEPGEPVVIDRQIILMGE